MPDVMFDIGGRSYTVACGDGEEALLQSAAARLGTEADHVVKSGQNLPESRVLLMAGLMLADQLSEAAKTPVVIDELAEEGKINELESALADAKSDVEALQGELDLTRKELESAQEKLAAAPTEAPPTPEALERATSALEDLATRVETAQAS